MKRHKLSFLQTSCKYFNWKWLPFDIHLNNKIQMWCHHLRHSRHFGSIYDVTNLIFMAWFSTTLDTYKMTLLQLVFGENGLQVFLFLESCSNVLRRRKNPYLTKIDDIIKPFFNRDMRLFEMLVSIIRIIWILSNIWLMCNCLKRLKV